ncbi:PREDICTED: uncharacterized protein LOC104747427 isoform X2 [Camelina sativa]|uniref:Uncharacterized protein LOC104747427 isoform X2 n=1 Tax=Camelina sativa TaxID=90675 RepID=A0ABM0W8T5_CAMSA|nr:PREDICTED: uncharacterized protein LOC104747427 isoform X2 [Camelina sativa]
MADTQQQSMIKSDYKPKKLPYSCEEVYERMDKGLCILCEEHDIPGHYQLKHKGVRILMKECEDDDQVSDVLEEVHQIQKVVKNPDTFAETVKNSYPLIEPLKPASVLQGVDSVADVLNDPKMDSYVEEVEKLPQQLTSGNGNINAHQVFDKIPLRITSKGKRRTSLKGWKFKFKASSKRGKMVGLSFEDAAALVNEDPKETIWDCVYKEFTKTMTAHGKKRMDQFKIAQADRVWEPRGLPTKLELWDCPEKESRSYQASHHIERFSFPQVLNSDSEQTRNSVLQLHIGVGLVDSGHIRKYRLKSHVGTNLIEFRVGHGGNMFIATKMLVHDKVMVVAQRLTSLQIPRLSLANHVWKPGGVLNEDDKWKGIEKCYNHGMLMRLMRWLPSMWLQRIKSTELYKLAICSLVGLKTWSRLCSGDISLVEGFVNANSEMEQQELLSTRKKKQKWSKSWRFKFKRRSEAHKLKGNQLLLDQMAENIEVNSRDGEEQPLVSGDSQSNLKFMRYQNWIKMYVLVNVEKGRVHHVCDVASVCLLLDEVGHFSSETFSLGEVVKIWRILKAGHVHRKGNVWLENFKQMLEIGVRRRWFPLLMENHVSPLTVIPYGLTSSSREKGYFSVYLVMGSNRESFLASQNMMEIGGRIFETTKVRQNLKSCQSGSLLEFLKTHEAIVDRSMLPCNNTMFVTYLRNLEKSYVVSTLRIEDALKEAAVVNFTVDRFERHMVTILSYGMFHSPRQPEDGKWSCSMWGALHLKSAAKNDTKISINCVYGSLPRPPDFRTLEKSLERLSKHQKETKLLFAKNHKLLNPEASLYTNLTQFSTELQSRKMHARYDMMRVR